MCAVLHALKGSVEWQCKYTKCLLERERELQITDYKVRREGGKSLLAYVKGVDPYLIHIDRPKCLLC